MHYVCFHFEFEHDPYDPDEECNAGGCPAGVTIDERTQLLSTVRDLLADWSDGVPANWDNQTVPEYLEAFAAWLADADGYYASMKRAMPMNGWRVVADAMRAARVYE